MKSIQGQLNRYLLIGASLLLLIAFLFLEQRFRHQLENEFDRNLLSKMMTLVTLTTQERSEVEFDFADEFMPEFETPEKPEYFQLWFADGRLLERSRSLKENDLPRDALALDQPLFKDIDLIDGRKGRLVQVLFVPHAKDLVGEEPPGANARHAPGDSPGEEPSNEVQTQFSVARGREDLNVLIRSTRLTLGITGILMLVAMAALVRLSVKQGLSPLREISTQVQNLNASSLTERINITPRVAELAPIVVQLNRLLDRLAESFDREKRFSGNVAHELRTPLAELRTLAEVGGKWPGDEKMAERFFHDVLGVTEDMEQTVANLLALARCESGNVEVQTEAVNLAELIKEIWKRDGRPASSKSLIISESLNNVVVLTDRQKVELMLQNLFDNAVEYSPANDKIVVNLERTKEGVGIKLTNNTENLAESDLGNLFDRFWRKDAARTSGHHAGLGLSLVKALADILHLKLSPAFESDHTFSITLSGFPLAVG